VNLFVNMHSQRADPHFMTWESECESVVSVRVLGGLRERRCECQGARNICVRPKIAPDATFLHMDSDDQEEIFRVKSFPCQRTKLDRHWLSWTCEVGDWTKKVTK
jgi:hypothetical protein